MGQVQAKLREARDRGAGVVLVSLDLEEVLALADRIYVFFEGRITGTFTRPEFDEREIGRRMLGTSGEVPRARAVLDGGATQQAAAGEDRKGLTPREIEVLRLISEGLNNQAIAERLFISEHTVHRHVANTLTKLNVSSRSAAVAQAGRLGLL